MKLAIDTNAYRALDDGNTTILSAVGSADRVAIPAVALGEIQTGILLGSRQTENKDRLAKFLRSTDGSIVHVDDDTASYYAKVFAQLRRQGTPIPTNDIWIAALCLQHGFALATFDSDFTYVPLLETVGLTA